jgi:long-chain acyl-CoA synthetase
VNAADGIRTSARRSPDKAALVFQGRAYSYDELDGWVDATAAALTDLGVSRGDRVALVAGNVPEFVHALYGTMRAGAVACPVNVQLTPEEIGPILSDAGASVAVVELPYLTGVLAVRDRVPTLRTVLVIGGPPAPAGTVSLEEIQQAAGEPPTIETEAGDLALLAYTSGTTDAPKGAMLTHGNLVANLDQLAAVPALAEASEDVVLMALPAFHIFGLNAVLGFALRAGATVVLVERFDAAETLDLVTRAGVTILPGAPPMFSAWLGQAGSAGPQAFRGVRLAVSGAAPLPREVLAAFRDRFGVTIWEGYGLTEAAPCVTTNALGPEARAGSIGLPLPGLQVRLVDEDGEDADEDDPGEIWVRGPNVFAGYWSRPEASSNALGDGWLRTGDVAVRDADGYLSIVDRKKDLIIVSGFNVYPVEVEAALQSHPDVVEAAVVGMPDPRTGEAVQAWAVTGQGLDEPALLEYLRGRLARFKLPTEIRIVDELPHHVTGKVLRRKLRPEGLLSGRPDQGAAEHAEDGTT